MALFNGEIASIKKAIHETFGEKRDLDRQKALVKQVVSCMTMGIDASSLYTEMIMAGETRDLVQKKMVYQYLAFYAKEKADVALLMINTLSKDFGDGNPLARGLALRTMTSLQLPYLLEHILPRLKQGLFDVSPYVRKTAVMGCAKLLRIARESIATPQIIERLHSMIEDTDPQVSVHALSALEEILQDTGGVKITEEKVLHFVSKFNLHSSWSQAIILKFLLKYAPASQDEVITLLNLLDPLLKSPEAPVVLAVAKLFLQITSPYREIHSSLYQRLRDPLIMVTSGANHEVTYVALSQLLILAHKQPSVFSDLYRRFFLRPTDPSYLKTVKIELLQTISRTCSLLQLQDIIVELAYYAHDSSPAVAHLAVHALIRTVSITSEQSNTTNLLATNTAASKNAALILADVVAELTSLLEIDWTCTCEAAIVGFKNILRNHRQNAAYVLPSVVAAMKNMEGRHSLNATSTSLAEEAYIWMLGEFGDVLSEAPYILESYVGDWTKLASRVRLQLLTSCARLFFVRSPEMKSTLMQLLDTATADPSDPDVHDKALYITRLLATNMSLAQTVFTSPTAPVETYNADLDPEVSDMLFEEFNSLSVIYRLPSSMFIKPFVEESEAQRDLPSESPTFTQRASTPEKTHHSNHTQGTYTAPSATPATTAYVPAISAPEIKIIPEIKLGQLKAVQSITSKAFETIWKNLPSTIQENITFVPRSKNAKDLEALFKDFKIYTVASGNKNGAITLFSYAQLDSTPVAQVLIHFLLEASGTTLNLTLKSENPDFAKMFLPFFKRVLSEAE